MPTAATTDRWRPGATFGLCASVVALGFVVGGFPGAFGVFMVVVGVVAVRRARRPAVNIPKAACVFVVLDHGDSPIAAIRFRPADGDAEASSAHLRGRGWSILEPPLDGPLVPLGRVGVAFHGDRSLGVHDLHRSAVVPSLIAERMSDLPPGWGRAAQDEGYVLLLLDDGGPALGRAPVLGAYALLRGMDHSAST